MDSTAEEGSKCCGGCCGPSPAAQVNIVSRFQRAVARLQAVMNFAGRASGGDSAFYVVAKLYAHEVRGCWQGACPRSFRPVLVLASHAIELHAACAQNVDAELYDYHDRFPNQFRFYAPQVRFLNIHCCLLGSMCGSRTRQEARTPPARQAFSVTPLPSP